jgi:cytochrome c oxidase assembly protein subunit 11
VNRNNRLVLILVAAAVFMGGMAFFALPLYHKFCELTGTNGTARRAYAASKVVTDRRMRVHFDANTEAIPWAFKAEKPYQDVRVGKTNIAYFQVTNTSDQPVTGRASYNILPDTMGPYFMKLQCFCFTNQTLKPGETRSFPVVYFLDPKLMKDSDTQGLPDVTLSYTFFEVKDGKTS